VGHSFGRDVAGRSRPDLDEELLANLFRQDWAIRRATMSDALPAAWPTMIFTGRDG
jgi:hypothetical protein